MKRLLVCVLCGSLAIAAAAISNTAVIQTMLWQSQRDWDAQLKKDRVENPKLPKEFSGLYWSLDRNCMMIYANSEWYCLGSK